MRPYLLSLSFISHHPQTKTCWCLSLVHLLRLVCSRTKTETSLGPDFPPPSHIELRFQILVRLSFPSVCLALHQCALLPSPLYTLPDCVSDLLLQHTALCFDQRTSCASDSSAYVLLQPLTLSCHLLADCCTLGLE